MPEQPGEPVERLGELLSRPDLHESLTKDPAGTLGAAGVDAKALSPGVLRAISTLSPDELAVLAKAKRVLRDSGAGDHEIIQIV